MPRTGRLRWLKADAATALSPGWIALSLSYPPRCFSRIGITPASVSGW
jgi:hypothetical protein